MDDAGQAQLYLGSLDKLVAKISEARGIDLSLYRRAYLERRVAARLRVLGMRSYRQYADYLLAEPTEYEQLMDTLTINVTDFFRDKVVWDVVKRRVVPEMLAEKRRGRSRTIRMWSAGCATGEEPYSMAMMMLDALGSDASDFLVSVLATDLDPEALRFAEAGVYEKDRLRRVPPQYQVRFFKTAGDGKYEVTSEVKRRVRFSQASLFEPASTRVVDLIMCRNVFIYFDREQQARVLENFWDALARGGYLVLGRSEKLSLEAAQRLDAIDGKERVYRRPLR